MVKIFYNPNQSVPENVPTSVSAQKPAQLIKFLIENKLPIEIVDFEPLSSTEMKLAHSNDYVNSILDCRIQNGFGNTSIEVAESLPWTTGSFVRAAVHSFTNNETVCSPTSGFHHAHYDLASAYCTFNGLMIAAIKLHSLGCKKIGIIDCDQHYGNGTDHIIKTLNIDYVKYYSYGYYPLKSNEVDNWLAGFNGTLKNFEDCELILYQAGADPFINDPLGGAFTMDQLFSRDQIIFDWARKKGIPVVWNLAGGYTKPFETVLKIHTNTISASLFKCLIF